MSWDPEEEEGVGWERKGIAVIPFAVLNQRWLPWSMSAMYQVSVVVKEGGSVMRR